MKRMIIAGNWKMNTTPDESAELLEQILKHEEIAGEPLMIVFPPYTSLALAAGKTAGSKIRIGAQNCHFGSKGAFTGEVSPLMLEAAGCEFVIIGHSERRRLFGESDGIINKKLASVLDSSLTPVLCIGETEQERREGRTSDILNSQIDRAFAGLPADILNRIILAYEPVWAIGTGIAATSEQVEETHEGIKEHVRNAYQMDIPLLYGGSMTADNALAILSIRGVNGGLIGGASLDAGSFAAIYRAAKEISGAL